MFQASRSIRAIADRLTPSTLSATTVSTVVLGSRDGRRDRYALPILRRDFSRIASNEELNQLLADHEAVYVLHSIPLLLESTAPSLAARLAETDELARFRGSLGGGDVVVFRFEEGSPEP